MNSFALSLLRRLPDMTVHTSREYYELRLLQGLGLASHCMGWHITPAGLVELERHVFTISDGWMETT